jgi:integrase
MPRKKKPVKRGQSKHPGVVIVMNMTPSGNVRYQARWVDPETGKTKWGSLAKQKSDTARRQWAKKKAESIAAVRAEMSAGFSRPTHTEPKDAVQAFLDAKRPELRPRTIETYEEDLERFKRAATDLGIMEVEEITGPRLQEIRDALVGVKRKAPSRGRGKGQGAKKVSRKRRSPATCNRELRTLKATMNYWRRLGLVPHLDRDAITDCLKPLRTEKPRPSCLPSTDLQKLLQAAQRHDAQRFEMTRAEKDGEREMGTTARYTPLAPFVAFVLLTGCRLGEALNLKWSQVNLDAPDEDGKPVGEILLEATATKTRETRIVDLAVSPRLRALLASAKLMAGSHPYVFGGAEPQTRSRMEAARRRVIKTFGAPVFSWQKLRQTCGSYLTNASGIFGSASAYRSARQLGHSVTVAERYYIGLIRGIPREARTLDEAMRISDVLDTILPGVGKRDTAQA